MSARPPPLTRRGRPGNEQLLGRRLKAKIKGARRASQAVSPKQQSKQRVQATPEETCAMTRSARTLLTPGLIHDAHDPGLLAKMMDTRPGQASWADQSIGKTCLECVFYLAPDGKHHRDSFGHLKEHRCGKYRQLKNAWGSPFPHHAIACEPNAA